MDKIILVVFLSLFYSNTVAMSHNDPRKKLLFDQWIKVQSKIVVSATMSPEEQEKQILKAAVKKRVKNALPSDM
ncbi:hypothetical protein HRU45_00565 [Candidatus Dependentiae bacterium]|nr:hypothetical protein [Candidatus Dependentiae bacterium]